MAFTAARTAVKTGSYTGDGSTSLAITGVGFKPKYVRIWERETTDRTAINTWETTAEILDDNALGMAVHASATQLQVADDRIISLDADGFTVDDNGTDAGPNRNGAVYNYLAIGP